MAVEAVKAYADCQGCKTRWKIDAVWNPPEPGDHPYWPGALVIYQDLRPCPLCGGRDCTVGARVTYKTP